MLKKLFCFLLFSSSCYGIKYQYLPNGKTVSDSDCTPTETGIRSRSSGFSVWGFLTAAVVVATAIGNLVRIEGHTRFFPAPKINFHLEPDRQPERQQQQL